MSGVSGTTADGVHDVVIIGSCPAGYTAALYTARAQSSERTQHADLPAEMRLRRVMWPRTNPYVLHQSSASAGSPTSTN